MKVGKEQPSIVEKFKLMVKARNPEPQDGGVSRTGREGGGDGECQSVRGVSVSVELESSCRIGYHEDVRSKGESRNVQESLMASTDLESFDDCLEDLGFGKVEESDEEVIFFCKTCFENNPPPIMAVLH